MDGTLVGEFKEIVDQDKKVALFHFFILVNHKSTFMVRSIYPDGKNLPASLYFTIS